MTEQSVCVFLEKPVSVQYSELHLGFLSWEAVMIYITST